MTNASTLVLELKDIRALGGDAGSRIEDPEEDGLSVSSEGTSVT